MASACNKRLYSDLPVGTGKHFTTGRYWMDMCLDRSGACLGELSPFRQPQRLSLTEIFGDYGALPNDARKLGSGITSTMLAVPTLVLAKQK